MSKQLAKRASAVLDQLSNASGRTVDTLYASFIHKLGLSSPFFKAGWGDLKVVNLNEDGEVLRHWPPDHFDVKIEWKTVKTGRRHDTSYKLSEGCFKTPCSGRLYDALPLESRTTCFQLLAPEPVDSQTACVIHLAGTGDHGYERRLRLGAPLLKQGIATLVLESPFYGRRRPATQEGSRLLRVSDLLLLGRATIEESLCLLEWAKSNGFAKLGMSGFSMGGVHASMVASLFPGPIACSPLLAPRSAAAAFCNGALWDATAWQPLASLEDEKHRDVMATVKDAAQPSLILAAAIKVLKDLADRHPNEADNRFHRESSSAAEGAQQPIDEAEKAVRDKNSATYGSAAAFLGFRLPGWRSSERPDSGCGISVAEDQLSSLWSDQARLVQQEARRRLETVLETYTDVTRFPCPKQPDAAVIVGALEDAYVTRQSVQELAAHWPGAEVRWVPGGHVSAFLLQQPAFRDAIADSVARLRPDGDNPC